MCASARASSPFPARLRPACRVLGGFRWPSDTPRSRQAPSGVLPGATVTVRQLETNTTRTGVTESNGQFYVPNLPAGRYELTVELSGFGTAKREIVLRVGQDATLDLTLRVGTVEESVLVSGVSAVVETRATVGSLIELKEIDNLPTIGRDFAELAKLAPGVSSSGQGAMGFSASGQRQFQNNVFVDGASNAMQFYGTQSESYPQDWVQEFQVMTNGFSAEFGQASGAVLNVITKSGTNAWQGRAYGFVRDDNFDTAPYAGRFVNGEPEYLDAPPQFNQQRFGAYLGGPVDKDSLFFFVGYENFQNDASTVLALSDYWRNRGEAAVIPSKNTTRALLLKGDWNVSNRDRISMRHSRTLKEDENCSGQGGDGCNSNPLWTLEKRATFNGPIWSVLGTWASTLSGTAFNEMRAYYGVNKIRITSNLAGTSGLDLLEQNAATGTFTERTYPGASFGAATTGGLEGETNFYLNDSFTLVMGKHQVKIGGQLARVNFLMDIDASQKGRWGFPVDVAFNRADANSHPDTFNAAIGTATHEEASWNYAAYIQDTWQVRNDLTLNLGVRYDVDNTITVGNNLVDARNERFMTNLGVAPLGKVEKDLNNVAPRLGFVWVPTDDRKLVVRGSAGIFYDQNHFNYNDVYVNQTLLANRRVNFNCNSTTDNPFYNAVEGLPASRTRCRSFLAERFPLFPNIASLGLIPELVVTLAPDFRVPYTRQGTIGLSRQLPGNVAVQADYIYSHGKDVFLQRNINLDFVNNQWVNRDPRFTGINLAENLGFIKYHALQTRSEYRGTKLRTGVSYTLAKATSNSNTSAVGGGLATNPLDLSVDEGPTNEDRRHNLSWDASYQFPLDFQLAGIYRYSSALPYSVSSRFVINARPEPRNSRRGDDEKNLDLRVGKQFRLPRDVSAALFWEMFNVLNADNFQAFQGSLESTTFGQPGRALAKRRQQFGFRVDF
ncbi:MAG: TonB-dependent receptor [Acidobacteria bacterium]|nr:TonB-dependent receptor [Acidobacteriota bacterium]